ncbi:MAG: hypothetical protein ACI4KO_06160 [Ruminiclostridium sp.]
MKKTKIVALIMAVSLLCSCGQGKPLKTEKTTEATTTAATTAETTSETTSETTAATEETTVGTTAEATAEKPGLKKFDINAVDYELYEEMTGFDLLSEKQQTAFKRATWIYTIMDLDSDLFFRTLNIESDKIAEDYRYHTGYSYDSVMNGFKTVLSEEILSDNYDVWGNLEGEFICGIGARGADISFLGEIEFKDVVTEGDKTTFTLTATYGDLEKPDGEKEYVDYQFEITEIDGNAVFTKFEFWK